MAEKGLGLYGGPYSALANCIIHATNAGADILSNSWGGYGYSQLVSDAVDYANAHGALVIAAAGNENTTQPLYPGAYEGVIAVSATNWNDTLASFSNYGGWVDISAPGVSIVSTMPTYMVALTNATFMAPYYPYSNHYSYMSGTSMACPNAAGVAALIWSRYPDMTAEFVRQQLELTCDDLGAPGFDIYFGQGRVNAQKAVEQSPPNCELIADRWMPPVCGILQKPNVFNVTILNAGLDVQTNIEVNLIVKRISGGFSVNPSINPFSRGSTLLSWTPTVIGTYNVTYGIVAKAGKHQL